MRKYLILVFAMSGTAFSMDLGTHGRLWPIEEVDMRLLMMADTAKVDWASIHRQLREEARTFAERRPPNELPAASETRVRWTSLAITLTEDIPHLRENARGEWEQAVLYPAGTVVNPFEHIRPVTRLLFFDGRSEGQVEFAAQAVARYPALIKPVLTAGNPSEITKRLGVPVFYATPWEIDRYTITHTPSLIGPGRGEHRFELAVVEFGLPYTPEALEKALEEMP